MKSSIKSGSPANSLALLLKLSGHDVQAAYDGPSALIVAEAFHPQVVLLDIHMPKLNGIEAAERIRAQQPAVGLLLLSQYDDLEVLQLRRPNAQNHESQ